MIVSKQSCCVVTFKKYHNKSLFHNHGLSMLRHPLMGHDLVVQQLSPCFLVHAWTLLLVPNAFSI